MPFIPEVNTSIPLSIQYPGPGPQPVQQLGQLFALQSAQRQNQQQEQQVQQQRALREAMQGVDLTDPNALTQAAQKIKGIDPQGAFGLVEEATKAKEEKARTDYLQSETGYKKEQTRSERLGQIDTLFTDVSQLGSTALQNWKGRVGNNTILPGTPSYQKAMDDANSEIQLKFNYLRQKYRGDPELLSQIDQFAQKQYANPQELEAGLKQLSQAHAPVKQAMQTPPEWIPDPSVPGGVKPAPGGAHDPKQIEAAAAAAARGRETVAEEEAVVDKDSPEFKATVGAAAKGVPLNQLVPGYGKAAVAERRQYRGAALEQIQSENPGISPKRAGEIYADRLNEYQGDRAAQRTLAQRGANLALSGAELDKFVPLASKAIDAVSRTGWQPINKLIQAGTRTWSPEQARLVAANRSVISAFSQLASRGVATVHNTEEAEKMLNTADSPAVYKATLNQLQQEATQALQAIPEARDVLRQQGAGATPAPDASGGGGGWKIEVVQ